MNLILHSLSCSTLRRCLVLTVKIIRMDFLFLENFQFIGTPTIEAAPEPRKEFKAYIIKWYNPGEFLHLASRTYVKSKCFVKSADAKAQNDFMCGPSTPLVKDVEEKKIYIPVKYTADDVFVRLMTFHDHDGSEMLQNNYIFSIRNLTLVFTGLLLLYLSRSNCLQVCVDKLNYIRSKLTLDCGRSSLPA